MKSSALVVMAACGAPAAAVTPIAPHVEPVAPPPAVTKPITTAVTPAQPPCDQLDLSRLTKEFPVVGGVCDRRTRAWLEGVVVMLPLGEGTTATLTDEHGLFTLDVPPGDYEMTFYYRDVTEERPIHVSDMQSPLIVQALNLP